MSSNYDWIKCLKPEVAALRLKRTLNEQSVYVIDVSNDPAVSLLRVFHPFETASSGSACGLDDITPVIALACSLSVHRGAISEPFEEMKRRIRDLSPNVRDVRFVPAFTAT